MQGLLQGKRILDLSHRLPGPLAGHMLSLMGAEVIKVEDETFKDPFIHGLFKDMEESFTLWYEKLNEHKQILRVDFQSEAGQAKVQSLVAQADGIIMGLPPKVQRQLKLTTHDLDLHHRALGMVSMGSIGPAQVAKHPQPTRGMHDLNALAVSGLLSLHVHRSDGKGNDRPDLPFLPIAGIAFGQRMALELLAAMLKAQSTQSFTHTTAYLLDNTLDTFAPFWQPEYEAKYGNKFLHNGRYPCYAIYRLLDSNYVALAAVEEKYWLRFCELFKINLKPEQRFWHQDDSVFEMLSSLFSNHTKGSITKLIANEDVCLDLI